jgi:hypothetical protein
MKYVTRELNMGYCPFISCLLYEQQFGVLLYFLCQFFLNCAVIRLDMLYSDMDDVLGAGYSTPVFSRVISV